MDPIDLYCLMVGSQQSLCHPNHIGHDELPVESDQVGVGSFHFPQRPNINFESLAHVQGIAHFESMVPFEGMVSFEEESMDADSDQSWPQSGGVSPESAREICGPSSNATSSIWTTASNSILLENKYLKIEEISPVIPPPQMQPEGVLFNTPNQYHAGTVSAEGAPRNDQETNELQHLAHQHPVMQNIPALLEHGFLCGSRKESLAMCKCRKVYSGKYAIGNLQRHLRQIRELSILGERPCDHCDVTCNRTDNLRQHCSRFHPTSQCSHCISIAASRPSSGYPCNTCDISFSKQDDYYAHMENRHGSQDGTVAQ